MNITSFSILSLTDTSTSTSQIEGDNSYKNPVISGLINLGMPLLLLFLLFVTSIICMRLIKRGKFSIKEFILWFFWNIFILFTSLYLIIIAVLAHFNISAYNIFDQLAGFLGINKTQQRWLLLLILLFLGFVYSRVFVNTIRIANLRNQVDDLARELAITNGKITNHFNQHNANKNDKDFKGKK